MPVLVIENFPATPLGIVAQALAEAGIDHDNRRADLGAPVPDDDRGFVGLIILGGGQSALDDADHPYLPRVARLARTFGDAGKPVLGICLGAQLLARGYGAHNILSRPIEFGWRQVRPTAEGRADPVIAAIGEGAPLFHWHTDTFTLPDGAVHLAASEMTELQAFRIGRLVYGIQFHFEADRPLVASWSRDFAETIADYAPDWDKRHGIDSGRYGADADRAGRAIARAWVKLLG